VLQSLDSLGAGFQLASHDLDIRGAGNLLGDEQSGHIREVGFELYQSMLEDAALYRRLNELPDRAAIDGFAAEMIDRFGTLPEEVANLLAVLEIKQYCTRANIAKVDAGAKGAVVTFQNNSFRNTASLLDYVARLGERAKFRPDQKLFVGGEWGGTEARLKGALALSKSLARIAEGATVKPAATKGSGSPTAPTAPAPKPAPPAAVPPRPAVFRSKRSWERR
jgi:transcription-repair coupling factor (superfamily II helicase)